VQKVKGICIPVGSNFPDVITTGRIDVSLEVSSMIATNTIQAGRQLPEEFESIFREHSEFVYRTAYRVTGTAEDAEDVMQTVFLKFFRNLPAPEVRQKPRAYLYRAAVNTALNVVRSRQREVLTDQSDSFESDAAWRQLGRDAGLHENLRMALADLKPKAAEIFILRYVHGYSDTEIGELLGTSRGTIAISLFRSRSRLRKSIRNYQGEQS
jgi:RNA polymerase sigma-70 factor (ECF subfamily)